MINKDSIDLSVIIENNHLLIYILFHQKYPKRDAYLQSLSCLFIIKDNWGGHFNNIYVKIESRKKNII